ncbi:hypothetical protein Vadar_014832 [Vaccinium darrowii]|uniref:Uncharacterized protein n=1 Tax=Vaccinium darrowii TaxID=229202 RepID=A0ACB7XQX3_9ERIC|nr:hypothetical protein Vadar_014832 [Vaccinium darrowii]
MPSFSSVVQWWEISCSSGWPFSGNSQGFMRRPPLLRRSDYLNMLNDIHDFELAFDCGDVEWRKASQNRKPQIALPGVCEFGKAIVCSDAAAEAVRYGFTTVERLEGFLVLAIASLGKHVTEFNQTPEAETRFQRMVLKPAF